MLNVRTKAERIKFDGTRKMSGEDQMMFQDHKPFVDKVRRFLRISAEIEVDQTAPEGLSFTKIPLSIS